MSIFNIFPDRRRQPAIVRRRRPSSVTPRSASLERLEPRSMLAVTLPPSISTNVVELDDNLEVADVTDDGPWSVTATTGHVQIFGNSQGRIDGTAGQSDEDLLLSAQTFVTVTVQSAAASRSTTSRSRAPPRSRSRFNSRSPSPAISS